MQDGKPFFLRDPWRFDPHKAHVPRKDARWGLTLALCTPGLTR